MNQTSQQNIRIGSNSTVSTHYRSIWRKEEIISNQPGKHPYEEVKGPEETSDGIILENMGICQFDLSFLQRACNKGPGSSLNLISNLHLRIQTSLDVPKDWWGKNWETFRVRIHLKVRNHLGIKNWLRSHKANIPVTWTGVQKKPMDIKSETWGWTKEWEKVGKLYHHWPSRVSENVIGETAISAVVGKVPNHSWGAPPSQMVAARGDTATATRAGARKTVHARQQPIPGAVVTYSFLKIPGITCRFYKADVGKAVEILHGGYYHDLIFDSPDFLWPKNIGYPWGSQTLLQLLQLLYVIMPKYL